jgi:hypothetical protein
MVEIKPKVQVKRIEYVERQKEEKKRKKKEK